LHRQRGGGKPGGPITRANAAKRGVAPSYAFGPMLCIGPGAHGAAAPRLPWFAGAPVPGAKAKPPDGGAGV